MSDNPTHRLERVGDPVSRVSVIAALEDLVGDAMRITRVTLTPDEATVVRVTPEGVVETTRYPILDPIEVGPEGEVDLT